MNRPGKKRRLWPWLFAGAVLLSNAAAFGGTLFPLLVALGIAWLLAAHDHHSGNNTPAIRRPKRKAPTR